MKLQGLTTVCTVAVALFSGRAQGNRFLYMTPSEFAPGAKVASKAINLFPNGEPFSYDNVTKQVLT